MRFLLKTNAALRSRPSSAAAIRNTNKEVLSQTKNSNAHNANTNITGRAWGQQCSPDCGCVLRFELQLSNNHISPELSTTETVASATYHAKRVMVTKSTTNQQQRQGEIDNTSSSSTNTLLRPLLTFEHASKPQRPILTTCTCNTLHELAQQVVNHLPGKTLQQLRNETELNGVVGTRTSMAFRHTVLSVNILPLISSKTKNERSSSWKKKFGVEQKQDNNNNNSGAQEMNATERYGHCYDLVEDSFLSMIYERSISPRKDDNIHAYSVTMGGSFHLYSPSRRQQHKHRLLQQQQHDVMSGDDEDDTTARGGGGSALRRQHSNNWLQQTSPSSYFLFGDDNYSNNNKSSSSSNYYSDGLFSLFVDYAKESIFGRDDNNDMEAAATTTGYQAGVEAVGNGSSSRPSDYLQLLDMYGDNHSDHENEYNHQEEEDDEPLDDWLDYVDTMQSAQGQQTTTSSG